MSSIPLSNEKISFTASLQEGWSGGQGSGDKSRAVKPDFPGLAREQKVLTTDEAFSKPLYLHPIETVNKTQKNQGPTTRGTMSSEVGNFGVSAYYIQNGSSEEEKDPYFQNKKAEKVGSNWFVADYEKAEKWPTAGKLSFYAYAPYNDDLNDNKTITLNDNKTIHYKVPEKVEDQPDFIVANSKGNSFTSSSVDLQFHHALTAITFSVSDDMEKGVINSIKIEGVKGKGDYNLSTKEWTVSSSSASYNVPISASGLNVGTGTVNLAPNATLMMIPQTLGDDAKVTINITPTDKSAVDLTFDLKDTKWVAGNHVTYLLSTTKIIKLNMGSVTYPQWQTAEGSAFTSEKLKSSYASGDALGMYVVDKYNKVIEENLKLTYNGSQWTVAGKELKGSPQYNYFVYYPYQEGGLPGAPGNDAPNIDVTSAEKFFADATKKWGMSLKTDQGDDGKFNSCDLQIGKADDLGESGTTINFSSMKHAMGLAEIVLGKKKFTDRICYLVGYEEYPTWKGTTTSYASSSIKNHTMYGIADHRYVSIVKPGENSFMSATDKDAWEKEVKLSPAANEVKTGTAYSSNINQNTPHAYTLAVGDIYYSDGAISHQEDDLISTSERIPIGIVGYTTMNEDGNYWTEKGVNGKNGHALVMCLKTIGSTGITSMGTTYPWYSSNSDVGRTKVNTRLLLVNSYKQSYGSGYTETNALIEIWGPDPAPGAAYQAKNYKTLPAPTNKCTGWFLPSAGQYYAVMTTLGAPFSDDWDDWPEIWDGYKPSNLEYGFFNNMTTVSGNINAALSKVGPDQYTEFFQGTNTWELTSSEFSLTAAVLIDSGVDERRGPGSFRFATTISKTRQLPVRPFLAF